VNGLPFAIAIMAAVDCDKFCLVVAPKSALDEDDGVMGETPPKEGVEGEEILITLEPGTWRELGIGEDSMKGWDGGKALAQHLNMVTLELDFDAAVGDYIVPEEDMPYAIITEFNPEERLCNTRQRYDS
jgi:hypothetical protein